MATGPTSEWVPPTGLVLLYSGGMDSEIVRRLYNPDVCVYVDTGTAYAGWELDRIQHTLGDHQHRPDWFKVVHLPGLNRLELPNAIIPTRNLLFATLGSVYGDHVWLAATAGDRIRDKDHTFAALTEAVLTHIWQPQSWTAGRSRTRVSLPVKHLSKGQLLRKYLEEGGLAQDLYNTTFSCYTPADQECGRCKACWRKWVAFASSGYLYEPGEGVVDHLVNDVVPLIQAGTYGRGPEGDDILTALRAVEAIQ